MKFLCDSTNIVYTVSKQSLKDKRNDYYITEFISRHSYYHIHQHSKHFNPVLEDESFAGYTKHLREN